MVMSSWRGRVVAVAAAAVISVGAVSGFGRGGGSIYSPTPTATVSSLPDLGIPSCAAGAVNVTTSSAANSNLASGNDVCVTASIGNLSLATQTSATTEHLGTSGAGQIATLDLDNVDFFEASVRATEVNIRGGSNSVTLQSCKLGGTNATTRTSVSTEALVRILDFGTNNPNITIQDCDIGWTTADNTGNSAYGIRINSQTDNLMVRRNWIHDTGSDGIQGTGGSNVTIDRNEIGPVGQTPGSSEHSDIIQVTSNDPGLSITNNYFHDQGYYDSGSGYVQNGTAGCIYLHGDSDSVANATITMDNNMFKHCVGQMEVCGLGSGGDNRTGVTVTNNTFYDLVIGGAGSLSAFRWDCVGGTGNTIQYNATSNTNGGASGLLTSGSSGAATWANNVAGTASGAITLDSDNNCTSSNCNPGGHTIGFRKPSGVHW
jgi:hypothetical protein